MFFDQPLNMLAYSLSGNIKFFGRYFGYFCWVFIDMFNYEMPDFLSPSSHACQSNILCQPYSFILSILKILIVNLQVYALIG